MGKIHTEDGNNLRHHSRNRIYSGEADVTWLGSAEHRSATIVGELIVINDEYCQDNTRSCLNVMVLNKWTMSLNFTSLRTLVPRLPSATMPVVCLTKCVAKMLMFTSLRILPDIGKISSWFVLSHDSLSTSKIAHLINHTLNCTMLLTENLV